MLTIARRRFSRPPRFRSPAAAARVRRVADHWRHRHRARYRVGRADLGKLARKPVLLSRNHSDIAGLCALTHIKRWDTRFPTASRDGA